MFWEQKPPKPRQTTPKLAENIPTIRPQSKHWRGL